MRNVDFNLLIHRKSQPTKNNNPTNKKNKAQTIQYGGPHRPLINTVRSLYTYKPSNGCIVGQGFEQ